MTADWRPFVFGGVASVTAECGKFVDHIFVKLVNLFCVFNFSTTLNPF